MFRSRMSELLDRIYAAGHMNSAATQSGITGGGSQREFEQLKAEILDANDRPRVGVGAVIIKLRKAMPHILLCKLIRPHGGFDGHWSVPGGWMEKGETELTATIREAREEVGVTATCGELMTATVNTFADSATIVSLFVNLHDWIAIQPDGPKIQPGEEGKIAQVCWYPLAHLPQPLFPPLVAAMEKHPFEF